MKIKFHWRPAVRMMLRFAYGPAIIIGLSTLTLIVLSHHMDWALLAKLVLIKLGVVALIGLVIVSFVAAINFALLWVRLRRPLR